MNCPRCEIPLKTETLNDVNVAVEVDSCSQCGGSWFDQKELSQVDKIIEPSFLEIKRVPPQSTQLKALYCPSCADKPLLGKAEHPRDAKVVIDYCNTCGGIWLDKGELKAIQKENWITTLGRVFEWLLGKD